jgi:hypothetical protein
MSYFARKENKWFYLPKEKIMLTENNVRPNRDNNDHILFMTIDVDLLSKASMRISKVRLKRGEFD